MVLIPKMCGDVKPLLIDLEDSDISTGRKQETSVQRERLSEEGYMYCVYWIRKETHSEISTDGYVGITKNFTERMRAHKKNKKNYPIVNAIKKFGWDSLVKEVLHTNLSLAESLAIELQLRPTNNIGWNLQRGGDLGVDSSWYAVPTNCSNHSKATSVATKEGIASKDTAEARSARAKQSWLDNRESYKEMTRGSNNPRAQLNEEQVKEIKYFLLPLNLHKSEIASLYNVKSHVIDFIRSGKNWSHI